ncbi:MAG: YebC/PmpR family DNA-binding transcriptional regulator, partial [Sphaerochaeta sp.]
QIFEVALENGADDVTTSDGVIEVITTPSDFANVLEAMQGAGFEQESAEVEKVADQTVTLESEKARKVLKIIDKLEELDDVQQVSSNLELPDDFEDSDEE